MIDQLVEKIKKANIAYRTGDSIMTDGEYDRLVEELQLLDKHHPVLFEIGHRVSDDRKSKLPIEMASMDKCKSVEDLFDWCGSKGISNSEEVIITPKYDGLSLVVHERNTGSWDYPRHKAWTRGDGEYGQRSTTHYELIQNKLKTNRKRKTETTITDIIFEYSYGEVIMRKQTFLDKYSDRPNPRNLVAGLLNNKLPVDELKDCHYIKYGGKLSDQFKHYFETKKEIIDQLNKNQDIGVPHLICTISELTDQMLCDLFHAWSKEFEIDGVIVELNELHRQRELGRERNTNPVWARAFKHPSFEQTTEAVVTGVTWNISKQGYLKPRVHIIPSKLDGVTVSNITGNNARFIKDMGLGPGARVIVKRSGMVIPQIVDVVSSVEWKLPPFDFETEWDENGVELITKDETDQQRFKQAVSFFEIIGVDNVREGVIRQLWDNGFNSIEKIIRMKPGDMTDIPGFGTRKTAIVHTSIFNALRRGIELHKLQHAVGMFPNLGSKKLELLVNLEKPTLADIMNVEGFAEKSARSYIDNIERFNHWLKGVQDVITVKMPEKLVVENTELAGKVFVFSGVRRQDLEEKILKCGGIIASGISKNSTHLVMKKVGSGSSKEKKAESLGQEIITVEQLEEML